MILVNVHEGSMHTSISYETGMASFCELCHLAQHVGMVAAPQANWKFDVTEVLNRGPIGICCLRTVSRLNTSFVTRYGKTDHSRFFMKIECVWIDAEFTVEFNRQRLFKKVPKPRYGLKIAHRSPVSQFTIFRETEDFVLTFNVSVYAPYYATRFVRLHDFTRKNGHRQGANTAFLILRRRYREKRWTRRFVSCL